MILPRIVVLATSNPGKVREITAILGDLSIRIKTLRDFSDFPHVVEDGKTLEENAVKKAREIYLQTGIPTLADDSGLEVFALAMRPGVFSARYAGEKVSYEDNNRKLLGELKSVSIEKRGAQFRCAAALVGDDFEEVSAGICRGTITTELRGTGGFGYDPLFVPEGFDQTFAELPIDVKNRMSHRARAFLRMKTILRDRLRIPS
ncbi:MAG: RdgB/HAM1 family non-canonical purine NTP pyrophosphatase [Ignavibacteriae bacterium]|nr:RdgB/HAM1 family non-canonical purine NTP pyrophosphatase [Ignavibacteria bacterium]MBI3364067.1 RdgB/HAM1 family non-canonical purine NTP pyrophosphatase [Ignavibacteriota bacterium]